MGVGVAIRTFSKIPVKGGNDGVLFALFGTVSRPLSDTWAAGIGQYYSSHVFKYFQEAVDKALVAGSEKEEIALLSRAIDIYKAPFLQTIEMKWVVERRETLRQLYAQALIGMARIYNRHNEDQRAIGFFTRALKETPEREDIHRHHRSSAEHFYRAAVLHL